MKRNKKSICSLLSSQSGFYMPLMAVVACTLVTFLSVYAFDKVKSNRSLVSLQKVVDDLCFLTTTNAAPMLQGQAAQAFRNGVQSLLIENRATSGLYGSGLRITSATLIIPSSDPDLIIDGRVRDFASFKEMLGNQQGCTLDSGADCLFRANLKVFDGDSDSAFYANLPIWSKSDKDTGSKVLCEIKAEFPTSVSGVRHVRVYSAESLPLRNAKSGWNAKYDPKILLAVAPQFSTLETDQEMPSRFSFYHGENDTLFDGIAQGAYIKDPAVWENVFAGNSEADNQTAYYYSKGGGGALASLSFQQVSLPTDAARNAQAKIDLVENCSNPASVVRNMFTTTLIELASRHGPTRNKNAPGGGNASLMILNPQHRTDDASYTVNHPIDVGTISVESWHKQNLNLPYLYYRDDNWRLSAINQIPAEPLVTPFRDYLIAPTDSSASASYTNGNPQEAVIHAFAANQLRYCYHLYRSNPLTNYPVALSRLAIPGITGPYSEDLKNAGMDSVYFDSTPAVDVEPKTKGVSWGQPNPYDQASLMTGKLSIAEVASMLGTVQSCPSQFLDDGTAGGYCNKPKPLQAPELLPDFIGLVKYLKGYSAFYGSTDSPSISKIEDGLDSLAFSSFGASPLVLNPNGVLSDPKNSLEHKKLPFGLWTPSPSNVLYHTGANPMMHEVNWLHPYNYNTSSYRHLVLITHRAPRGATEVQRIQSAIKDVSASGENLLTVIFIPTKGNATTVKDQADRLAKAFFNNSTLASRMSDQTLLLGDPLLVLSPWSGPGQNLGERNFGPGVTQSESEHYRKYWRYMLDFEGNPDRNIVEEAKRLFVMRLLRREKIL